MKTLEELKKEKEDAWAAWLLGMLIGMLLTMLLLVLVVPCMGSR